jgi:hypothetical protein
MKKNLEKETWIANLGLNFLQARMMSVPLGIGLFYVPWVFFWFLLRPGYSKVARLIGLSWMVFRFFTFPPPTNNLLLTCLKIPLPGVVKVVYPLDLQKSLKSYLSFWKKDPLKNLPKLIDEMHQNSRSKHDRCLFFREMAQWVDQLSFEMSVFSQIKDQDDWILPLQSVQKLTKQRKFTKLQKRILILRAKEPQAPHGTSLSHEKMQLIRNRFFNLTTKVAKTLKRFNHKYKEGLREEHALMEQQRLTKKFLSFLSDFKALQASETFYLDEELAFFLDMNTWVDDVYKETKNIFSLLEDRNSKNSKQLANIEKKFIKFIKKQPQAPYGEFHKHAEMQNVEHQFLRAVNLGHHAIQLSVQLENKNDKTSKKAFSSFIAQLQDALNALNSLS